MNNQLISDRDGLTLTVRFLLLAGIVLLLGFHFYFAASNLHAGYHFSDSVRYLFMADSYGGASDKLTVAAAGASLFPPFFPLVLNMLGGGSQAITAAHVITVLTMALACLSCFWWLSEEKMAFNTRLLIVLLLLLLPGTFELSMLIASEYLFQALVFAALAALRRNGQDGYWFLVASLLVGLSITTRTVGIALLPCLALVGWKLGYRRILASLLLALGPYVTWRLLRDSSGATVGYLEIYSAYFDQNSYSELIRNVGIQFQLIFQYWARIFDRWLSFHVLVIHGFLLLGAGAVFLLRLRRLKMDSVFLLFYLGIIGLWPFPHELERFTVILLPFFLFFCMLGVNGLAARFEERGPGFGRLLTAAIPMILLVTSLPTLLFYVQRFNMPAPPEISAQRFAPNWYKNLDPKITLFTAEKLGRIYHLMQEVEKQVPEDECIYTTQRYLVMLYTRRQANYLPLNMYENNGSGSDYDVSQLQECNYIIFLDVAVKQISRYDRMYPILAVQSQVEPILTSSMTLDGSDFIVAAFAKIIR